MGNELASPLTLWGAGRRAALASGLARRQAAPRHVRHRRRLAGLRRRGGKHYDFVIAHGDDRCWTRIVGVRVVPAAVFDAAYRAAHAGRITVEVPEVYELVNVALAMTATGLADRYLVYHDSDYHRAMRGRRGCRGRRCPIALELAACPRRSLSREVSGGRQQTARPPCPRSRRLASRGPPPPPERSPE